MIRLQVYLEDAEIGLEGWDFHLVGDSSTVVEYERRNEIFFTETTAFLHAVMTGDTNGVLCDFHDALKTQRVVDAIHRSVTTGAVEDV